MYYVDYLELVGLNSDELKSILKSNRINWEQRKHINILITHEIIKEFVPIIAMVGVVDVIMTFIKQIQKNKNEGER